MHALLGSEADLRSLGPHSAVLVDSGGEPCPVCCMLACCHCLLLACGFFCSCGMRVCDSVFQVEG